MPSIVITHIKEGVQMKTNDQSPKFGDSKRLCFDKCFGIEDCAGLCVKVHTNIRGKNASFFLHHDDSNPKWGNVDTIDGIIIDTHMKLLDELYKVIQ